MNRSHQRRLWIRAAAKIRKQYQSQATGFPKVNSPPEDQWARVMRLSRLLTKAQQYQYPAAFQRCFAQLKQTMARLIHELTACHNELTEIKQPTAIPSLRELAAELSSLPDEFDETSINWSEHEIVVRTPTVILREVNLGEFEIHFHWSELGNPQPYRIVSLTQTGEDDVHHPHVQGDTLCEGEGKFPIYQALADGRLGDFFLLVHQILQTYNPGSAYVSLDHWGNTSCTDCGDSMSREESRLCSVCEHQICDSCCRSCAACDDSLCSSCANTCSTCGDSFCSDCLSTCDTCGECCCRSCLSDQTCSNCLEESMENEDATSENPSPDASPAASSPAETPEAT